MTAPQESFTRPFSATQATWSPATRRAVTVLLLFHLSAILVAPCAVPPASHLFHSMCRGFRPYLQAMYLNHGFHFFAPEPGPSHLIRYEMEMADGTRQTGYLPDKIQHQPRLRYHRHFMLTEHLNAIANPDTAPKLSAVLSKSYAEHLLAEHHGQQVKLFLVRHLIPVPEDVAKGMPLDDSVLYHERLLGSFSAGGT